MFNVREQNKTKHGVLKVIVAPVIFELTGTKDKAFF